MYNKKGIVVAILYVILILILRIVFHSSSFGIVVLQHVLMVMIGAVLLVIGSGIRMLLKTSNNRPFRFFVTFIMFVSIIDLFVWMMILLPSNPALVNIFFTASFLPLGYFFIKRSIIIEEVKHDDIFELYDKEESDEDIFDVYLKQHKKDNDNYDK